MRRFCRAVLILLGLALLAAAAARSWVVVDETQFVLVTEFGRPVAVYGAGGSGLHAKWPWQSAEAIDRRFEAYRAMLSI